MPCFKTHSVTYVVSDHPVRSFRGGSERRGLQRPHRQLLLEERFVNLDACLFDLRVDKSIELICIEALADLRAYFRQGRYLSFCNVENVKTERAFNNVAESSLIQRERGFFYVSRQLTLGDISQVSTLDGALLILRILPGHVAEICTLA